MVTATKTCWSQCALQGQRMAPGCYSDAVALALMNLANAMANGPDTFKLVVSQACWHASYPCVSKKLGLAMQIAINTLISDQSSSGNFILAFLNTDCLQCQEVS